MRSGWGKRALPALGLVAAVSMPAFLSPSFHPLHCIHPTYFLPSPWKFCSSSFAFAAQFFILQVLPPTPRLVSSKTRVLSEEKRLSRVVTVFISLVSVHEIFIFVKSDNHFFLYYSQLLPFCLRLHQAGAHRSFANISTTRFHHGHPDDVDPYPPAYGGAPS